MSKLNNVKLLFKHYRQIIANNTASVKNVVQKLDATVQKTFIHNKVNAWKDVFIDYRDVAVNLCAQAKEKPFKALCVVWGIGGVLIFVRTNPDEDHFRNAFLRCYNALILVPPTAHNKKTYHHLQYIQKCYSLQLVRTLDLIIVTIVWKADKSQDCKESCYICPYLPRVKSGIFTNRIIDVGFFHHWLILDVKMINYDVDF